MDFQYTAPSADPRATSERQSGATILAMFDNGGIRDIDTGVVTVSTTCNQGV